MNKKIIFIADYFENEIPGGGEKCNEVIIEKLLNDFDILKIKSRFVDIDFIKNNIKCFFIIYNFLELNKNCLDELTNKCKYIIYEHDHKYLKSRNPALYKQFLAPKNELTNLHFYKNANLIICQTKFHADIVKKNIEFDNIISASTNFWSDKELNILQNNINLNKNEIAFILDSNVEHKNTYGSIQFCKQNNIRYFAYSNFNYENFIREISKADKFIFLPKTPETFGRVATECKILGMKIYSNNLLGVSHEDWFKNYKNLELIEYIKNSNASFIDFLKEKINE